MARRLRSGRPVRRRTLARAWLAALVAVVTACALPLAQARAASCKRAAILVDAVSATEGAQDHAGASDTRRDSEAPRESPTDGHCPSVVATALSPLTSLPALAGDRAALTRDDRAPPRAISSGLERPPRRA